MESLLSPSDFLSAYDEFKSLSESKVQTAIDEARDFCLQGRWGDKYNRAIALLAAHILAMRWLQVGAIAASSVQNAKGRDGVNRMDSDAWLTGTVWGQQFLHLRKSIVVTGFWV
jgi:Protein of unknown function (DUF4054)